MIISPLPAPNNFADLREASNKFLVSTADENIKHLVGIVGTIACRCDLLESEVERVARSGAREVV